MHPRLPYWYHIGRAATPVKGDVYVIRGDGSVVHTPGPAILTPRMKFFASQQTVSNLVAKKLVKRLPQPKEPKEEAPEEVAVPSSKSEAPEPVKIEESKKEQEPEAKDEAEPGDDVIASDAGEAEDSPSEPEENQENRSSRRRKKSRRE